MSEFAELIQVVRGGVVDNIHRGCAVVVDSGGQVVFSLGDPDFRAFIRSAAKPLQALALVEHGGVEAYGLTDAELAIICASHVGGELQVNTVRGVLKKIGVDESMLRAGSGIKDNCSGKHAGMLALAKLKGFSLDKYLELDHPIQTLIMGRVADMCGLAVDEIEVAIDGCGAPIFAVPLSSMALSYAKLANCDGPSEAWALAAQKIARAMQDHPEMLGGLDLKGICGRKMVAKSGASGCYCAGFTGKKLGLAVKVVDGARDTALPVTFEIARRLDLIDDDEYARFVDTGSLALKNRCDQTVGERKFVF